MNNIKKIASIIIVLSLMIMFACTTNVFAGDANHNFSFTVGSYHKNGRNEVGRYRKTTNPNNAWKVQLVQSGEGSGTITRFWLEHYDGENVSDGVNVTQGVGATYSPAYSSASQSTVYLTGENNNYNGASYSVSGYWDEETGVFRN